jgi:hypothetical protein
MVSRLRLRGGKSDSEAELLVSNLGGFFKSTLVESSSIELIILRPWIFAFLDNKKR